MELSVNDSIPTQAQPPVYIVPSVGNVCKLSAYISLQRPIKRAGGPIYRESSPPTDHAPAAEIIFSAHNKTHQEEQQQQQNIKHRLFDSVERGRPKLGFLRNEKETKEEKMLLTEKFHTQPSSKKRCWEQPDAVFYVYYLCCAAAMLVFQLLRAWPAGTFISLSLSFIHARVIAAECVVFVLEYLDPQPQPLTVHTPIDVARVYRQHLFDVLLHSLIQMSVGNRVNKRTSLENQIGDWFRQRFRRDHVEFQLVLF